MVGLFDLQRQLFKSENFAKMPALLKVPKKKPPIRFSLRFRCFKHFNKRCFFGGGQQKNKTWSNQQLLIAQKSTLKNNYSKDILESLPAKVEVAAEFRIYQLVFGRICPNRI